MFSVTNFSVREFVLPMLFPVFYVMEFKNRITNALMLRCRHGTLVADVDMAHVSHMVHTRLPQSPLSPPCQKSLYSGIEEFVVKYL